MPLAAAGAAAAGAGAQLELLDMWVHTRAELATQISARRDALLVALEALRAAEEVGPIPKPQR